jgi:hypothetical protein
MIIRQDSMRSGLRKRRNAVGRETSFVQKKTGRKQSMPKRPFLKNGTCARGIRSPMWAQEKTPYESSCKYHPGALYL